MYAQSIKCVTQIFVFVLLIGNKRLQEMMGKDSVVPAVMIFIFQHLSDGSIY